MADDKSTKNVVKDDPGPTKKITPSGADVSAIEKLNPPTNLDVKDADSGKTTAPLTKTIASTGALVVDPTVGADDDAGSVAKREGVRPDPDAWKPQGERIAAEEGSSDEFAYGNFKESGMQPAGGAQIVGVDQRNPPLRKEYSGYKNVEDSLRSRITKMMKNFPDDTPDDHIIYGYGGVLLYVKDLRELADMAKGDD